MYSIKKNYLYLVPFTLFLLLGSCSKDFSPIIAPPNLKPTTGTWHFLGLEDKYVVKLRLNRDYLYACAATKGLWRLNIIDDNEYWEHLGLVDTSSSNSSWYGVQDVAFDEQNDNWLLVAFHPEKAEYHSVYRTFDGANSWNYADSSLLISIFHNGNWYYEYARVNNLIENNNRILGIESGAYYTNDFGDTWHKLGNIGAPAKGIYDVKISPQNSNIIWIGPELEVM